MILLYFPILFVILTYSVYRYFSRTLNYWKERGIVGPEPVPLFGNLKDSALRRKNLSVVFEELYKSFENEKVIGIYRMTTPCLLIRDPDIIKHIMIKDFDNFVDRGMELSKEGLGNNLFHADGDTWRILRSRFTPLFTSGKLKNMLYLILERGDKFIEYINSICFSQCELEIYALVQKYTISTITACAFGLDIDTFGKNIDELKEIDKLILTPNYAAELDMMYPGILRKLGTSIFSSRVRNFFDSLVKTVVTQRNGKPMNRKDFMDLILELRQEGVVEGSKKYKDEEKKILEITDSVISAQAFVFYVGGYETSATTMTYMLYQLALNPDIQDKLISEVDEILNKCNGKLTYEVLQEMTYMEKVFSETLRMYPIVDPLQRNAKTNYKIPGTEITIQKNQTVLVSVYGLHHDEKYYADPEKFDPERFSPENVRNRHPCAYLPFGTGPRNCIGMRFAQLQSRVCLVKFLSKFRVEPSVNTPKSLKYDPYRIVRAPLHTTKLNVVCRK